MNEAIVKTEDKGAEFVPFGSSDKVKLSVAIVKNLVAVKTKTGKTCSDTDAIKFIAMCQARRLNPFEGDAFLIGYDGKDGPNFSLITAHQAFLKRAELNAEYDGMKSGVIVKRDGQIIDLEGDFYLPEDTLMGGWATVYFKNRKQPMHKRVRLQRFQKAWGIWQDDPAGMICKCAEADALRSSFPTMLGGLYLKEELAPETQAKASRPIFAESTVVVAEPAAKKEEKKQPEPEPEPDDRPSYNVLKAVRGLIENARLKESDYVAALIEIGSVEAGTKSLDDVDGDTIQLLHDQFAGITERIKENK